MRELIIKQIKYIKVGLGVIGIIGIVVSVLLFIVGVGFYSWEHDNKIGLAFVVIIAAWALGYVFTEEKS